MKIFYSMFLTILLAINCTGYIASEISKPIRDSEMHKIESGDITQYYYTLGNKNDPPLVFIHGILAFTEVYRDILKELSEQYYVIGIDLRGHGRTTVGERPFSYRLIAEDIINVTDEIGIDQF